MSQGTRRVLLMKKKKNVKISCKCTFTKTCYHREINFTQVLTEGLFEWLSEMSCVCVAVYINAHPVLCVQSEYTPQSTVFGCVSWCRTPCGVLQGGDSHPGEGLCCCVY